MDFIEKNSEGATFELLKNEINQEQEAPRQRDGGSSNDLLNGLPNKQGEIALASEDG